MLVESDGVRIRAYLDSNSWSLHVAWHRGSRGNSGIDHGDKYDDDNDDDNDNDNDSKCDIDISLVKMTMRMTISMIMMTTMPDLTATTTGTSASSSSAPSITLCNFFSFHPADASITLCNEYSFSFYPKKYFFYEQF